MKILAIGDFHGKFPEKLKKEARKVDLVVSVGDYTGLSDWRPIIMAQIKAAKTGTKVPSPEEVFGKKKFKGLLQKDFDSGKKILTELNNLGKKVILIFGNSDDEWYKYPFDTRIDLLKKRSQIVLKKLKNIKIVTYSSTKFKGINFIGFGGYMDIDAYFDKKIFKSSKAPMRNNRRTRSKQKFWAVLKKIKGSKIFILHYPPKGVFDIIHDKKDNPMNGHSAGINFFREGITKYKPIIALCGHMHEYQGMKKIGKTTVINPGAALDGKAAVIDINEKKKKIVNITFIK